MYPLENQVCTLEQAKKFNELGLKLESYFVWVKKDNTWRTVTRERWRTKFWTETVYSAYSCAELGMLLPKEIQIRNSRYFKTIDDDYPNGWRARNKEDRKYVFYSEYGNNFKQHFESEHEAHVKSDLLLHLLKEKIVKPEDISL